MLKYLNLKPKVPPKNTFWTKINDQSIHNLQLLEVEKENKFCLHFSDGSLTPTKWNGSGEKSYAKFSSMFSSLLLFGIARSIELFSRYELFSLSLPLGTSSFPIRTWRGHDKVYFLIRFFFLLCLFWADYVFTRNSFLFSCFGHTNGCTFTRRWLRLRLVRLSNSPENQHIFFYLG